MVTENERDFPRDYCAVFGVEVIHHDNFLEQRFDLDPELALQALDGQAARMRDKPSVEELLRRLAPTLPRFVRAVQEFRAY